MAALYPISQTGVVINIVSPGLCDTELNRHVAEHVSNMIIEMRKRIGRTAEAGSRTLLYSAVAGPDTHGKYTANCRVSE